MAEIHWLKSVNGNFDTSKDWSGGVVPGQSDDVFLDAPGTNRYTDKVEGLQYISTLQVASTATLDIGTVKESGALIVLNGLTNDGTIVVTKNYLSVGGHSGDLINRGTVVIDTGGSLDIYNIIENTGLILFNSGSSLFGIKDNFTGGGTIALSGGVIAGGATRSELDYATNVDNLIEGFGVIGGIKRQGKRLNFTNEAAGVVDANAKGKLIFETGVQTVTNAGLIEATNGGVCVVESTVSNTGTLEAAGGTLMLERAVTGSGTVAVAAGTLVITNAGAAEKVTFKGQNGMLELDQSQTYAGKVTGFSLTGQTTLDLRDIGFVSPDEATFSGTNSSGVLTVTDGTHTAQTTLVGDYLGATFTAASDGKGGVDVVAASAQTPSVAHFAGVMAAMNGHGAAAELVDARAFNSDRQLTLATPRLAIA